MAAFEIDFQNSDFPALISAANYKIWKFAWNTIDLLSKHFMDFVPFWLCLIITVCIFTEVSWGNNMGDKVIPVKVAVRVRPLVPKEVRILTTCLQYSLWWSSLKLSGLVTGQHLLMITGWSGKRGMSTSPGGGRGGASGANSMQISNKCPLSLLYLRFFSLN